MSSKEKGITFKGSVKHQVRVLRFACVDLGKIDEKIDVAVILIATKFNEIPRGEFNEFVFLNLKKTQSTQLFVLVAKVIGQPGLRSTYTFAELVVHVMNCDC